MSVMAWAVVLDGRLSFMLFANFVISSFIVDPFSSSVVSMRSIVDLNDSIGASL